MHPRNPYRTPPDFEALARGHPALSHHIRGRFIDFHDDAAQRCLTQALLKRDFNLEIDLPPDRLCPPVPNRLNYALWIQDIVNAIRDVATSIRGGLGRDTLVVRGLDIGTGASAIYPLLGCALEPTWAFIATELDERSYNFASTNVCINNLSDRICVVKISGNTSGDSEVHSQDGKLQFGFEHLFSEFGGKNDSAYDDGMEIQFTMCNPPFYRSLEDVTESEAVKEFAAFGVCTGAPVEMITPGGEVHFVGAMVRESVHSKAAAEEGVTRLGEDHKLKEKRRRAADGSVLPRAAETEANSTHPSRSERQVVRWYTSMLGKMSSVEEIVKVFKELTITNYAITEFVQGQTRRWAVGWSHSSYRLSDDIARIAHPNPTLQRLLPLRNTLRFPLGDGAGELLQRVLDDMEGINVSLRRANDRADNGEKCEVCMVLAMQDSWSRGARRKRKRDAALGSEGAAATLDPALACLVAVVPGEVPDLEVRWVYGRDRALFESFASHVAAKVNRGCTVGATALF